MLFFRGITVPALKASSVLSSIKAHGLQQGQGRWHMEFQHPGNLNELFDKSSLSISDTRPEGGKTTPAVCACGDYVGASHYAWQHNHSNENDTPIIIEFEAPPNAVAVDGRDFLYSAFQLGEPSHTRPVLEKLFGQAVMRYAEKAWQSTSQSERSALCDLAVNDPAVVQDHHENKAIIGGRYKTLFASAFLVRLPVDGDAIIRAWCPIERPFFPQPQVSITSIQRKGAEASGMHQKQRG